MSKKPKRRWTKHECRTRYIYGEDPQSPDGYGAEITLRQLVEISGRSLAGVGKWSSDENWFNLRKQELNKIRTKTSEKLIEKVSDRASDKMAKLNEEYLATWDEVHQLNRDAIAMITKLVNTIDDEGNSNLSPGDKLKLKFFTSKNISLAIQRACGNINTAMLAQRKITGADYEFIDKAIDFITNKGFDVSDPSEVQMIEYLEQQGYEVQKKVLSAK